MFVFYVLHGSVGSTVRVEDVKVHVKWNTITNDCIELHLDQ